MNKALASEAKPCSLLHLIRIEKIKDINFSWNIFSVRSVAWTDGG